MYSFEVAFCWCLIERFINFFKAFLMVFLKLNELVSSQNVSSVGVFHILNNEKRLINDLTKNYQVKFGRPVNNMTERVIVYFEIMLIQLIDLVRIKIWLY